MGKNHRHVKKVKSERSKVKLKTQKTKFLPKGQNVTDTNFKIKPIVVSEQLIQHKTQTTSQNLDFKDIINRLKHHNVSVNLNSLLQLKEFIYIINDGLDNYVLQILEHLCPIYINLDQKLRRQAISLTHHLIKLIKSNGVEPHVNRIISYLCCMMTHLNENVQEDSLQLFDVLIQLIPDLIAERCDKIIKNFILLISKVKITANDKSMLQNSIKNKRTSIEWRLMVLTRFKEFLKVILNRKQEDKVILVSEVVKVDSGRIHVPIYYKKKEIDVFREDVNVDVWLDGCVKDVLGLLKGIWMEVQPVNKHSIQSAQIYSTPVNNEVLNILNCILSIISCFYELMLVKSEEKILENDLFMETSKELITKIFESFPFSKLNNTQSTDSKCFDENLTVCYLFFAFFPDYKKNLVYQTTSYLNVCLVNRNYVPQEKSQLLLKPLKQFFRYNIKHHRWNKNKNPELNSFIYNIAKYYIHSNNQKECSVIFQFLSEHIDSIDGIFYDVVKKGCRPLIGAKIDMESYKAIRSLLLRGINEVELVLAMLLPQILSNLNVINFEGIEHVSLKENKILGLFKNVSLNDKNLRCLEEFSKKSENNLKLVKNVLDVS